jgi:hypothetical protein
MLRKYLFAIAAIVFVFSCADDDKNTDSGLTIKTGTVCGWCAVNDTLTITRNTVRYVNYTNCSANSPEVTKSGQMESSELEGLLAKLNFSELKKLDLNSSNVSFDGCDDWISFTNGKDSHFIRFTRNDPKLQPIHDFVEQLNSIKARYKANN